MNIAIDGPGGAGKSTIAKAVAAKLGIIYVDTGALYRTVGYYAKEHGITLDNIVSVVSELDKIMIELKYENGKQCVYLNGENPGDEIRKPDISMYASAVSAIPEVRAFLLELQRKTARENSVIMDGRDIGTVILPDAEVKIFLTASPEVRAMRRYKELTDKGLKVDYDDVLREMNERDKNDSERAIAPLVPAKDAVILDTTDLPTVEKSVNAVLGIINSKKI